jgi:aldehyde dehydrogenase (NAD+)
MLDSGIPPITIGAMTSFDPRTGEAVADVPLLGPVAVGRVVRHARAAQPRWAACGFGERKRAMLEWKRFLVRRCGELAELISAETGKPTDDALIEVMNSVEHLDWAARHAARVLGRRFVDPGPMGRRHRASVAFVPYGVVGVIGPADHPLYTPIGSIAYALAAGNAVVFKPSELAPAVGLWLAESWRQVVADHQVLYAVTGDARTGMALLRAGVDKISFTGSPAAARTVAAVCAESLTPLVVTGGGKDAMLVHADAELTEAADAAVYGAMANGGQTPGAVARAFVAEPVYDRFVELVAAKARALRTGGDGDASYGPMTEDTAVDTVRRHVRDALDHGGRAVVGGMHSFREPFIEPIVLVDVPDDSAAVTEHTHGPVLIVSKVRDADDAVDRLNASSVGTAVAVFTRSVSAAVALAQRLRTGAVTINSVFGYDAMPAVPLGGVGPSGYGRLHGAAGLREFSRTQAILRRRGRPWLDLNRIDRKPAHMRLARALFLRRHLGRGGPSFAWRKRE